VLPDWVGGAQPLDGVAVNLLGVLPTQGQGCGDGYRYLLPMVWFLVWAKCVGYIGHLLSGTRKGRATMWTVGLWLMGSQAYDRSAGSPTFTLR
jgi:hypothetical protein